MRAVIVSERQPESEQHSLLLHVEDEATARVVDGEVSVAERQREQLAEAISGRAIELPCEVRRGTRSPKPALTSTVGVFVAAMVPLGPASHPCGLRPNVQWSDCVARWAPGVALATSVSAAAAIHVSTACRVSLIEPSPVGGARTVAHVRVHA